MVDSECLFECMNDVYEAGVQDDVFALLCEANKKSYVAVQTPNGLSRRDVFENIVMQGDVLAPLVSSLQVDTIGKECWEEKKHLYFFKDKVPIGPLGMVDDLLTISECGYKTEQMNQYINFKTGAKRLQFGTSKCIKMHIGKMKSEDLCKDVFVNGWKIEVETDTETGNSVQSDVFTGREKMEVKEEQTYLGDLISADGSHTKNVQLRRNKGIGVINQIMQIMHSTYFGKNFFEIAMVLRESLLLSSILLNSEAWVGYTDRDVRILEQCDEILLTKVLDCDANTSNALKYLDLGIVPIRYEIMKRKVAFLQYILLQDKKSMMFQVLKATEENPTKNDFVLTCQKYLKNLEIPLTFDQISEMSKLSFKRLLKQKTKMAALKYLNKEKSKQSKIMDIQHSDLEMQEYLFDCDRNLKVPKLVFKARAKSLDIKVQKSWKYDDLLCSGCQVRDESGDEILFCKIFGENEEKISYSWFYSEKAQEQVSVAKLMMTKLKTRERILEEIT